jgi:hypothetical protein
MNRSTTDNAGAVEKKSARAAARFRGLVPGLSFFAAGIVLSALWFSRTPSNIPAAQETAGPPPLSDATKVVLQSLNSPVELRFYSLLDPTSVG